jgi:hypothetical protein
MDSSSSKNFIDSIGLKILFLVIVFSSLIFSAKADNGKDKGKEKKQKQESSVIYSADEKVLFEQVTKEFEQKTSKAIANTLQPKIELIRVIDANGKVILETSNINDVPSEAAKLMDYGKIAFYIVNL